MPSDVDNETYQHSRADADSGDGDEQQSRRVKRGKYVLRACAQCQRRKIRCDGGTPCSQCVARKRDCVAGRHQAAPPVRGRGVSATETMASVLQAGSLQGVSTSELLDRLISVEQQMKAVMANRSDKTSAAEVYETPAHSTEAAMTDHGSPGPLLNVEDNDRHTFVGETSMLHALRQTEEQLNDLVPEFRQSSPLSSGRPLTPKLRTALNANAEKNSRSWLRAILLSYGIVPDKAQCDTFLRIYFDEIHVLYPFLHPPTVWRTYDYLWQRSLLVSSDDLDGNEESRLSVAIVFICLATGRCTGSSRVDNADGTHSAGWSLYSVAMYLLRQFLDMTQESAVSLHGLQALALMVVYLFRLDASEKAERMLAYAVSGAHIMGLHRKATYERMHVFENEMSTRVWWCLYALDRRMSLGTGRPFVIQDVNNDTRNPFNVSDDWLEQHKSTNMTISELENEIRTETSLAHNTTMPYLEATISYSKIVGDVWQAVYGSDQAARSTPGIMCDYLDILLENSRQTLPSYLKYQPSVSYEDQFSGLEWWQVKESIFIHMRYTFLRLLIRRPVAPSIGPSLSTHDNIGNEAVCAQLASSIIDVFDNIPAIYPKYAFPFINYMMSATMILFSIVIQNSAFKDSYRKSIASAVQSLSLYCRKTWVSGKTIRTVSKLSRMVRGTLGQPTGKSSDKSQNRDGGRERRQYGDSAGADDGTASTIIRPSLPPTIPTQASEPQHAAQYWATGPSQFGIQQNNSTSPVSSRPAIGDELTGSPRTHSTRPTTLAAILSPISTESLRVLPHSNQSQTAPQQPPNLQHAGEDSVDFSFLWRSTSSESVLTDLPSWAMTDFDFEQSFNGTGNLRSTAFTAPEMPDLDAMHFH